MAGEKLIDVIKDDQHVLHTFLVEAPEPDSSEARLHDKALSAATHSQLVPSEEFSRLSARDHVSRGGPLRPYGDNHGVLTESKAALEQDVRERAYFLWENAGCPEERHHEFWHQAREDHFRERAYRLWEYEGHPEGHADRHWHWTRDYEDN